MSTDNEGLLSRWSRRKLQSPEQNQVEDDQLDPVVESTEETASSQLETEQEADVAEQPVLTDADMPDIESLHEDSDFSMFMSPGVSDRLRNLALRKMFQAPVFNITDGLDEYDEDFTTFEELGDIVTCDMKHQIEMDARKKMREELEKASVVKSGEDEIETTTLSDDESTESSQQPDDQDEPETLVSDAEQANTPINPENIDYEQSQR